VSSVTGSLRVPGFRPLAVSYALNELGDNLGVVALAILVLDRTDSALGTTALFLCAKFLPALLAPALTAALDRRRIGRVLPGLYAIEAAAFVALAQLTGENFHLALILVLGFADGLFALTARGLSRGAVANILEPAGLLREGNALLNVAFAVTSVAGTVLAGVFVEVGGASLALWLDAGSFLAIAILLAAQRGTLPPAAVGEPEPWLGRVRDGLRYVREHPVAGRLVAGEAMAILFFTVVVPIEVVYARETLDSTSVGYGVLLASWGAGILLGSAVYARTGGVSTSTLVLGSTALIGIGYAGMAVAPVLAIACVASVIGGAGNGVQWVAVMTALQESVGQDYQARAAGLLESVGAAVPGLGFIIGGTLTVLVSPRLAFAVAALGVLAIVLAWARRPIVAPEGKVRG
jgi:MFS family permease